ncbi:MAG: hypothetical protein D6732_06340 [Methanobacteriota archaeon]|nr:MAG: hypothetical protein D6732_06340 [Euryarchaeota archaeon]
MGRATYTIIFLLVAISFGSTFPNEQVTASETEFGMQSLSIGLVMRTFTGAAYSGYYSFFSNPNLNAKSYLVRDVPTATSMKSTAIYALRNEGFTNSQIHVIDDRVVHKGGIFTPEGLPKYDVLLFFHNEYVTLEEYHNVARFVKAGGNVIILNGNAFFGEVDYNEETDSLALFAGHGWEFDGQNGTRMDIYKSRFLNTRSTFEHYDWIGSRYHTFRKGTMQGAAVNSTGNNPHPVAVKLASMGHSIIGQGYSSYEENTVVTPNMHTIATWQSSFQQPDRGIRIYEKFPFGPYGGSIIHIGIFSVGISGGASSFLNSNEGLRAFLKQAILHQKGLIQKPWIKYPYDGGVFNDENIPVAYTPENATAVYLNGVQVDLKPGDLLKGLQEGNYNLTVAYSNETRSVQFSVDRTAPLIEVNSKAYNASKTFSDGEWVNVTAIDPNINYLRAYTHDGIHSLEWSKQLTASGAETNISATYKTNGNKTKYMFIQAIDGAGNSATHWIKLNPDGDFEIAPQTMPVAEAINSTHAQVTIPAYPNRTYIELQVGDIWTQHWTSYPFYLTGHDPTNSSAIAIFPHQQQNLAYRVAARINNRTEYYYSIQKFPGEKNILWLESKEELEDTTTLVVNMFRQPFSNYNISAITYRGNVTQIEPIAMNMKSPTKMEIKIPTLQLTGMQFLMLSGRHNYSIPIHLNSTISRLYYIHPEETSSSTILSPTSSPTASTISIPSTSESTSSTTSTSSSVTNESTSSTTSTSSSVTNESTSSATSSSTESSMDGSYTDFTRSPTITATTGATVSRTTTTPLTRSEDTPLMIAGGIFAVIVLMWSRRKT